MDDVLKRRDNRKILFAHVSLTGYIVDDIAEPDAMRDSVKLSEGNGMYFQRAERINDYCNSGWRSIISNAHMIGDANR